jgi:hypothetical protein
MESEKILNDLQSSDSDVATSAITSLKISLDRNNGILMIGNMKKLYRGFYNILASHSFEPVHQWTNLLIDLLKNDDPDTEIHFSKLIPILIQNLGSTKIPICSATFNCLKTYNQKIGGLTSFQLRPTIVLENLYLGVEAKKTNLENIREYLLKLTSNQEGSKQPDDQLEQELMRQSPAMSKFIEIFSHHSNI